MIGAIIGDIAGSTFEFHNTDNYNFEIFAEGSTFTDDSICTIAIADAICEGVPYKDKLLEWCRRYPNVGFSCSFRDWFMSNNPQPYGSFGNGSAMRVSPVAWAFDSLDKVLEEAAKTAQITHNHPNGIRGAVAVAHAIFALRITQDISVLEEIGNKYYPNFLLKEYHAGVFNSTCEYTVPLCFKIMRYSHSFEDAIRRAISWGGDSDTIGTIVGSMAEALWEIPIKFGVIITQDMNYVVHKFNNKFRCHG